MVSNTGTNPAPAVRERILCGRDYSYSLRTHCARLRRFPLNVRAVSAKIKLPKKYLQHCHILRTDKKNLSLLLLPS